MKNYSNHFVNYLYFNKADCIFDRNLLFLYFVYLKLLLNITLKTSFIAKFAK